MDIASLMLAARLLVALTNEPLHDKTNKMTFAPGEDSVQPGHPPSLIRVFAVCSMGLFMQTVKTDQTGGMHRLIRVFTQGAQVILLVLSCGGSNLND